MSQLFHGLRADLRGGTALCPRCQAGNGLGRAQDDREHGFSEHKEMVQSYQKTTSEQHLWSPLIKPVGLKLGLQSGLWEAPADYSLPVLSHHNDL